MRTTRLFLPALSWLLVVSGALTTQGKTLYYFDIEKYFQSQPDRLVAWQADVLRLVAALQGLVNRPVALPETGRSVPDTMIYINFTRDRISGYANDLDDYWLGKLRSSGRLLADYTIVNVETLEELLTYPDVAEHYSGVILWDENVPATANVAMTASGIYGYLPIRRSINPNDTLTLHHQLIDTGPQLKLQETLVSKFMGYGLLPDSPHGSITTKSRKCDAYLWAIEQMLEKKLCSDQYLAYYLDGVDWDPDAPGWQCNDLYNAGLLNADFFVSEKAFFFDLDPWWNEKAPDELRYFRDQQLPTQPPQGADELIVKQILDTIYRNHNGQNFVCIGGFIPWFLKYTTEAPHYTGMNSPETTEAEFLGQASAYNCYVEGDAYALTGIANASVFRHAFISERFEQNAIPTQKKVETALGDVNDHTYLLFFMGDFDSPAWLEQAIPSVWNDANRGMIDLAWGINPSYGGLPASAAGRPNGFAGRGAPMIQYLYETRTPRDYFVAGNSGFGYLHPRYLEKNREFSPHESALLSWWRLSRSFFRFYDYQITGLVINGKGGDLNEPLQDAFYHFSPHGVVSQNRFDRTLCNGIVPFILLNGDLCKFTTPVEEIVNRIASTPVEAFPSFQVWRCIMTPPGNLYHAIRELQNQYPERKYEVVDPYTFFYLYREHQGGTNTLIGIVWDHDIPSQMEASMSYTCNVVLRNDGWDTWNDEGIPPDRRYRLGYFWIREADEKTELNYSTSYIEPGPVVTGEKINVEILTRAPDDEGLYRLRLFIEQEGGERSKLYEDLYIYVSQ